MLCTTVRQVYRNSPFSAHSWPSDCSLPDDVAQETPTTISRKTQYRSYCSPVETVSVRHIPQERLHDNRDSICIVTIISKYCNVIEKLQLSQYIIPPTVIYEQVLKFLLKSCSLTVTSGTHTAVIFWSIF